MPELPEVETMVRGLRPVLSGQVIERIELHDPLMLHGCEAEEFARRGSRVTVEGVTRRGKWVAIELANQEGIIVIQPRMTGGFWLIEPPRPQHIRLTFRLAKGDAKVWYCDIRRLGKIHWFAGPAEAEAAFRKSHGPDALEIDAEELARRAGTSSSTVVRFSQALGFEGYPELQASAIEEYRATVGGEESGDVLQIRRIGKGGALSVEDSADEAVFPHFF